MAGKRATLHMLCGKIAAGKSTLAAQIAQETGAVLMSEDHFLAKLYPGEIATLDDYVRCARRLREAVGPHIAQLLRSGMSVVLDFQANTPSARSWMRELFEAADAHHQLHYLQAPDALCKARLAARNASGAHEYQVSEAEYDLFTSYFVAPSPAEGFEVLLHDQLQPAPLRSRIPRTRSRGGDAVSEFTIRPEKDEADRVFIHELNARLSGVIDAPSHSKEEVVVFQERFTASAWAPDAGDSATFVAVSKGDRRLGYVNVRESADEIANEKCGYIALLAVIAEAEGEGVGQSLLQEAEKWTREMGFRRLSLDVFASNRRGQCFYEKAGFRPETIRLIKQV